MLHLNYYRQGLFAAALIGLSGSAVLASTVGSDFSTNGGDGWSYGEYNNGSVGVLDPTKFLPFTIFTPASGSGEFANSEQWYNGPTDPNVEYNSGSTPILTAPLSSDIDFQAGTINLGPYLGPTVVRYTIPSDGEYAIQSTFETVQIGNTDPFAYLYIGTALLDSALLADPGSAQIGTPLSFNVSDVSLTAGETVDFVVWGGDTDNKTTELSASVTAVPLPSTAATLPTLLGLIGLAAYGRRIAKNHTAIA